MGVESWCCATDNVTYNDWCCLYILAFLSSSVMDTMSWGQYIREKMVVNNMGPHRELGKMERDKTGELRHRLVCETQSAAYMLSRRESMTRKN